MVSVSSQKSSFQHLHDAPLQGRTISIDVNFTSHVCGFCATSLGVRSSSRPVHQATGQGFPAGTSVQRRIMPKWDLHLVLSLLRPPFISQVEVQGKSSDDVIPLKWQTLNCVFLLALASARWHSYLHALSTASDSWVFDRENTQQQLVVSLLSEPGFLAKNQLPTQAPEWIRVPGIASWIRRNRREYYVPLDSWSSTYGTLKESGGAVSVCSYTGTAASKISWGAT